MATETQTTQTPAPQAQTNRHRSRQLVLTVPTTVAWTNVRGEVVQDRAIARNVSIHGASLHLADGKHFPGLNSEVTLKRAFSGELARARVARLKRLVSGKLESIAVELVAPSESSWGLTFQMQRATAQLLEIETACQGQMKGVDFRVLKSLAEAVEQLRNVASIVQEWQELQAEGKNAYSVLDALDGARVRKATHLLGELSSDIDSFEISSNSDEFSRLVKAVEGIYDRMTRSNHVFREGR
jgi:hypothetical protein